uniref:SWI/SNF-related matrix-associated actin-dependent regulator of chromatin subfamily A-like protein 1 n=1 Tax=Lygus hesperus TaxID=30085 RepID=A0A0A9Y4D8_LYGHE
MTIIHGTKPLSSTGDFDIIILSYSSLKSVETLTFKVVILDESHFIKDSEAKRTRSALQLCHRAQRVVLLTGTPAMSRPIELHAQLMSLQPSIIPSRYLFAARYCNAYRSHFGVDMTGHSHTDELHFLLSHFVIRRTKKELGDELPCKTRQLLYIHVT